MQFSRRMNNLGTETAFAVGGEAAKLASEGKKIYPFHLGDMNIITPKHIREATVTALNEGKTGYCPTAGIQQLREELARDIGLSRNLTLTADNVSVQPGGKPVISKFLQIFMNPGDEVLYPNPGYPIYESQINYFGGIPKPYGFIDTPEGFALDMNAISASITPNTTLFIYNNYQNPTGASSTPEEMEKLADICKKHNLIVLSDEAYFDMIYEGKGSSIASLPGMFERTLILYTFSKKYAMTGWRLGAAIGPKDAITQINRINVNDESCSNHFIQYGAICALQGPDNAELLSILKKRRDIAVELLNSMPGIQAHTPNSTFYLFPKVTDVMKKMGLTRVEEFRKLILNKTGVSFCTRNHFGTPLPDESDYYVRFAYSGIDTDQIVEGLTKMKRFIEQA